MNFSQTSTIMRRRARAPVHFRSFPADRLLRWEGEASLCAAFFNSLKARLSEHS